MYMSIFLLYNATPNNDQEPATQVMGSCYYIIYNLQCTIKNHHQLAHLLLLLYRKMM